MNKKDEVSKQIGDVKESIENVTKEIRNLEDEMSAKSNEISECNADLTQISDYRLTVDIEKARHVVNDVGKLVKENGDKLQILFKEKETLTEDIKDMEDQMANIPDDYSDSIAKLKRGISNSKQNIADWSAEVKQAEKELEYLKGKMNLLKEVDDKLKGLNSKYKDYTIINKAFSNTGIQALELDSASPEISAVANQILSSTYGDRFTISFETQRDGADGRKIEDFVINVFDSKSGRKKKLDILSGGETVWIKNALYYAFSVVRSRSSGFCFKTRFLDESDGTLDSGARMKYLAMIETAHRACNANLTILVTHSQEIKEIVDQKIEITSS